MNYPPATRSPAILGVGDGVGALGKGVGDTASGLTSGVSNATKSVGDTAKSGTDGIGGKKQDAQNPLGL
jgi:hypothetical protein